MIQDIINALMIGGIYTLIAVGLTLIFGILDIVNFAHGEFYMLGGFACFFVVEIFGFPYIASIPIAMAILGIVGILTHKFIIQRIQNEPHFITLVAMMGLSISLQQLAILLWKADSRQVSSPYANTVLRFLGASFTLQGLLVILTSAALIILFYLFIKNTKMGKAMRATAQNQLGASALGIDTNQIMRITVGIGSAIAAAAGALIGPIFLVYPSMGVLPCLKAFVVVILGGMGNVQGAIFGGLLLGVLEIFVTRYVSSLYRDAIAFVILIVVLLVMPTGLFGMKRRNV